MASKVEVSTKDLDTFLKIRALYEDALKRDARAEAKSCLAGLDRIKSRYPGLSELEFDTLVDRYQKQRRTTPGHQVDWRVVARAVLNEVLKGWRAAQEAEVKAEETAEETGETGEEDEESESEDEVVFEHEVTIKVIGGKTRIMITIEDLTLEDLPLAEGGIECLFEEITETLEEALHSWQNGE